MGLTTVDVAKKARVSKTTVIKYLSMLSSEGEVEFVRWDLQSSGGRRNTSARHGERKEGAMNAEASPMMDIDFHNGEDETILFLISGQNGTDMQTVEARQEMRM